MYALNSSHFLALLCVYIKSTVNLEWDGNMSMGHTNYKKEWKVSNVLWGGN